MEEACRYSDRPLAFLARYVRRRPVAHAAIATAVVAAVGCSVGAQYGVKVLVDTLAGGLYVGTHARDAWLGFLLLATLIAADNLLWRVLGLGPPLHFPPAPRGPPPPPFPPPPPPPPIPLT